MSLSKSKKTRLRAKVIRANQIKNQKQQRIMAMGRRINSLTNRIAKLEHALTAIDQMAHPHDKVRDIAREALGRGEG